MEKSENKPGKEFFGGAAALATPFTESGDVCYDSLRTHLDFLYKNGITRILAAGTTGEFFSLTLQERIDLLSFVLSNFKGTVFCNAGAFVLKDTLALIRNASDTGAAGIFVLPPSYPSGLSAGALKEYFRAVASESDIPFYIYNFPKHTGNPVTPEILNKTGCAGVKDSSKSLDMIPELECEYITGGDSVILESSEKGAGGFISARANAFPEVFSVAEDSLFSGRGYSGASRTEIQKRIDTIAGLISSMDQIQVIKYLVSLRIPGYSFHTRLPLPDLSEDRIRECCGILQTINGLQKHHE